MKKIFIIIITVIMVFQFSMTAVAQSYQNEKIADSLKYLGVFQGTDTGYALDKTLTRVEAITMIVRLLGKEECALSQQYNAPFTDVPDWAKPYVNYAYHNNITKGVSETEFNSYTEITIAQFLTLILRLLGYDDQAGQFQWNKPFDLAYSINLIDDSIEDNICYRDKMVLFCWNALHCNMPKHDKLLVSRLIEDNVFTLDQFIDTYDNILQTTINHSVAEKLGFNSPLFPSPDNTGNIGNTEDTDTDDTENDVIPPDDNVKNDDTENDGIPPDDNVKNDDAENNVIPPDDNIENDQIQQPEDSLIGEGEIGEDW